MRGYLPVAPMLCVPSTASGRRPITPGRLQGTHLFDLELHGLRAVIYGNGTLLLLRGAERSPPDDGGLPPSARFSVCVPASQCSLVLRKVVESFPSWDTTTVTLASNVAVWASDLRELTNEERRALDDVELRRVERMPRPDRARSLLGAILIRRAAASALGCHPAEVPVSRRCSRGHTHHGRPVVTGADISLSLSHASRCLVVAVTSAASVGVDVEDEDPGGPMRWDLTLSEGELPSTCAGDRVRTWVRKEAVLKARGDGWDTPFAEVRLSAAADAPRLLSYRGEQLRASLHDLPLSGFLGAVAVLREGVGLDWRGQLDADLPPVS